MTAADQPTPIPETATLVALSKWIDAHNAHKSQQLQLWERCGKLMEETGEVGAALIGVLGQNPRKGITHTPNDLTGELLDVAITALGAVEHVTGNEGRAMGLLRTKLTTVVERAGLLSDTPSGRHLTDEPHPIIGHRIYVCDVCGDESAYCDGSRHNKEDRA